MASRTADRERFLADIIIGAVEGGTGYWAQTLAYKWQDRAAGDVYAVLMAEDCADDVAGFAGLFREANGRKIRLSELIDECGDVRMVDVATIAAGLGKVKADGFAINRELKAAILRADRENDAGAIDAEAADVIVQAALFGDIIYG